MSAGAVVEGLTVEYQVDPMPLDEERPRFGWQVSAPARRGVRQRAYEVVVGTRPHPHEGGEGAEAGGIVWTSGRVHSDASVGVEYEGPPPASRTRYFWAVRVWVDEAEPTAWSPVAWWETGLAPGDWQARWVEPVQRPARPDPPRTPDEMLGLVPATVHHDLLNPAQYVRTGFAVRPGLVRARVYATAHGVYTAEVNGRRLGDQELAPEPTSYAGLLMYQAYDATDLVAEGDNAIGFVVADGWWAGRFGLSGRAVNFGDTLGLLAQVELHYADGTSDVVTTDGTWRSATGGIVYADLLVGQKVDARLEPQGWTTPRFDDSGWTPVRVADTSLDNLTAHIGEPVRVVAELPARTSHATAGGAQVLDVGQLVTGRVRLELEGLEPGTEVRVEHAQVLGASGDLADTVAGVDNENLDVYVARGGGPEVFEPRHTFHGFRYVRLTGLPRPLDPRRVTAVALSSDLAPAFELEASDPRVEQLQRNIMWTLRDTFLSVPMDNPDRERAGWTGDFAAVVPTATVELPLASFVRRYLRNVAEDQLDDGTVPLVVPLTEGYREMMRDVLGVWSSPAWGDVVALAPWAAYRAYGDARLLEQAYGTMRRFHNHVTREAARSLTAADRADPDLAVLRRAAGYMFGDWLTPSVVTVTPAGSYDGLHGLRTADLVPTLYHLRSTDILADVAQVLGRDDDEAGYRELARALRRGFRKAFVADGGRLTQDTQGNYVLALAFGAAPELDEVFASRLRELVAAAGGRLDTGFLSTGFLLPVLTDHGHADLAYSLLLTGGVPSWMHMLGRGATTVWEMWNAVEEDGTIRRVSFAQPGLASVGSWIAEYVAGIRPAAPGYARVELHPVPGAGLDRAEGRYRSVRGEITSRWERRGADLHVDVAVPANCSATVVLEGARVDEVRLDDRPVVGHPDVVAADQDPGRVRVEVGSGAYGFRYPHHPAPPPVPVATRAPRPAPATGRYDLGTAGYPAVMADPEARALVERLAPELPRRPLVALAGGLLSFEHALRLAAPVVGSDRAEALRRDLGALA